MTRFALATMLLLGLPLTVTGCDSTVIGDVPFITYDLGGTAVDSGTVFIPGKPLVGMLIDRVGRPAINLALTNAFALVPGNTTDGVKNQYNAATPGNWPAYALRPYIAESLSVFDGIDGTCGNQLSASQTLSINRYITLANNLADDRLYINATSSTCQNYLAVETNFVGDCGGYHPSMNAMDVTLNYLATGMRMPVSANAFTNGITSDVDGGIPFTAVFPFLRAPN